MKIRGIIACFVLLAGCTTAPPAVSGSAPKGYEASSKAAIRQSLKNPFDVREFRMTAPYIAPNDSIYRGNWQVCARFYAQNSFGAIMPTVAMVTYKGDQVSNVNVGTEQRQYAECASASPRTWN